MAFSDWLRGLLSAKVERDDKPPARGVAPSSGRISAKPAPREPYVYREPYKAPVDLGRKYPEGQIPRHTSPPRAVGDRPPPKNSQAIGLRTLKAQPREDRSTHDDWTTWGAEAEVRRQESLGQQPSPQLVQQIADDKLQQRTQRTPEQARALKALQELDAKTSARVDQEFAAEGRKQTLATERPLTDAEYAALSPRQQAAILFNTGLIDAGRADEAAGGGIDATKEYLSRFGISPKGDDLTSFLRLDDLISDSILQKLDDLTARQDSASSLRWARGDEKAAGDSARFLRARGSSDAAAEAISLNLSSTGNPLLSGGTPLAGFGSTDRDNVVKFAFTNMVDSRWNMTWDDVVSGLNQLNTNFGTDVSPEELWQYAGAAVSSVDFARAGSREADVYNMTTPDPEDKDFTPIDAAEIRRRYGL